MSNIKIFNLDEDSKELTLPYSKPFSPFFPASDEMQWQLPKMPITPEMIIGAVAPLPGDYISIKETFYKVEQRLYHLDSEESWIELWVREEKKQ